jgi:hypothetical protein
MDNAITTVFFIVAVIGVSLPQQLNPRCLFNRLDVTPCKYQNRNLRRANEINQYSVHHTRLRESPSGFVECNVRARLQDIADITNLGTDDMRIIYSPGFIINDPPSYDDQLLVQFNIDCGKDNLAFFDITSLNIQGAEDCEDRDGNKRCQDYILIDRGDFGTSEICGNESFINRELQLNGGKFRVFFRSSEQVKGEGFQMYVICFREAERDLPGCLRPSNFSQPVCCNFSSEIPGCGNMTENSGRRKRDEFAEGLTYRDFFPEYPPGMRIRKDVASFHNQWQRQRRGIGDNGRFESRIILFNESVNYTDSVIRIFDADNIEVERYGMVAMLQTLDGGGNVSYHFGSVTIDRNPHFFGPGTLIITGRIAYFQLFGIDPRGLIPNPEEERDLAELNAPLLDAVPESEDLNVTDPNPIIPDLPLFDALSSLIGKRDVEDEVDDSSSSRRRRQAESDIMFTEDFVFLTLRNLQACNPVLRSQARANVQVLEMNETLRDMLNGLRMFNISCILTASQLQCNVTESFAPVVPGTSYCQINNQPEPVECDPFSSPYEFPRGVTVSSVIVTAINCNGQTVEHTVNEENSNG